MVAGILTDLSQQAYLQDSERLAVAIQAQLNQLGGIRQRGVKQAPFVVLRSAAMPAVLVETAFISNPREEARLMDPAFRKRVALAITRGVRRYFTASAGIPAGGPACGGGDRELNPRDLVYRHVTPREPDRRPEGSTRPMGIMTLAPSRPGFPLENVIRVNDMLPLSSAPDGSGRMDAGPELRSLGEELRAIIDGDRLKPHFQAILDLRTGRMHGFEGLSRGPSDSLLHSPLNLFKVALLTGQVVRTGSGLLPQPAARRSRPAASPRSCS